MSLSRLDCYIYALLQFEWKYVNSVEWSRFTAFHRCVFRLKLTKIKWFSNYRWSFNCCNGKKIIALFEIEMNFHFIFHCETHNTHRNWCDLNERIWFWQFTCFWKQMRMPLHWAKWNLEASEMTKSFDKHALTRLL